MFFFFFFWFGNAAEKQGTTFYYKEEPFLLIPSDYLSEAVQFEIIVSFFGWATVKEHFNGCENIVSKITIETLFKKENKTIHYKNNPISALESLKEYGLESLKSPNSIKLSTLIGKLSKLTENQIDTQLTGLRNEWNRIY